MPNLVPSLRRAFSQPAFVVVAIVLFVAGSGLNGAIHYLKLNFQKSPVPPALPMTALPAELGPWKQVSIDQPLGHEYEEALGTDKFVFRDYVDTRLVSPTQLAEFKDKTPGECHRLMEQIQIKNPAAVVNVGLTYYTGLVDTVAHIPDRCYIADGYEPTSYDVESWSALKARPDAKDDDHVRFIVFEDTTPTRSQIVRQVAYFFHCNGAYTNDPLGVRKRMATLNQKYAYYMKIELQTISLPTEQSKLVMNDFLTNLLPESEKCLPDWKKYGNSN